MQTAQFVMRLQFLLTIERHSMGSIKMSFISYKIEQINQK